MSNQLKKAKVQEGIFFIIFSVLILKEALKYNRYGSLALSPSLAPMCVAVIMLSLAVSLLIKGIKEDRVEEEPASNKWKDVFLLLIITILYLILLPVLHFILSTILYLVVILILLGENNKKVMICISLITTFAIYGLFKVLLNVVLP